MGIFKKDYIVGLDIGSSSIKVAEFTRGEGGLRLVRADLREARGADEKEILHAVRTLLKGVDINNSKFIVSINCPKTCLRTITAPNMPKAELRNGLGLTAKEYFPFPIDDSILDFEILGEIEDKGAKKQKVLVAASPKMTVDKYLSLLKKLGIRPSSFVPVPVALERLVERSRPKKDEVNAFLDIGDHLTELAIFSGRELLFCRKIPVAGDDITKAMTGVLVSDRGKTQLSIEEAELIKRQVGIPSDSESKMIEDKISTIQILSMIRPSIEQLVSELDRCFDYYREESGGGVVDSLTLLGGGASLKGLPEFLARELGVEVKLGNPLENIKLDSKKALSPDLTKAGGSIHLAPAVGAALSLAKGINLLPVELKEQTRRTVRRATILGVSTAVVLSLSLIYIGMNIQFTSYKKRINVAKREYTSLLPQLKLAETQDMADAALAAEPYWEDIFKELSHITPNDIYLTELSMEAGIIKMMGLIEAREAEGVLSSFILTLERGIFKKVKLVTTKDISESASIFEIKCWVD